MGGIVSTLFFSQVYWLLFTQLLTVSGLIMDCAVSKFTGSCAYGDPLSLAIALMSTAGFHLLTKLLTVSLLFSWDMVFLAHLLDIDVSESSAQLPLSFHGPCYRLFPKVAYPTQADQVECTLFRDEKITLIHCPKYDIEYQVVLLVSQSLAVCGQIHFGYSCVLPIETCFKTPVDTQIMDRTQSN